MRRLPFLIGGLALLGVATGISVADAAFTCPTGAKCFAAGYTHPIYVGSTKVYTPPTTTTTTAPPTTIAATTTTAAPTTTAAATTTAPATTAPATTTTAPEGFQFVEDFTGNTGLDAFRELNYDRNLDGVDKFPPGHDNTTLWPGDHDMSCGAPTTHRTVTGSNADRPNRFWVCSDHLMTIVGDWDAYTIVGFAPKQTFSSVNKVCWDANLTDEGTRNWWDVSIVPASAGDFFAPGWIAGAGQAAGSGTVAYEKSGGVHFAWGPFSHHLEIGSAAGLFDDTFHEYTLGSDVATRRQNCAINNGNGTATFTQDQGGTRPYSYTANVTWPSGPLKVIFGQHGYTPTKDQPHTPYSFTVHWDRIEIS